MIFHNSEFNTFYYYTDIIICMQTSTLVSIEHNEELKCVCSKNIIWVGVDRLTARSADIQLSLKYVVRIYCALSSLYIELRYPLLLQAKLLKKYIVNMSIQYVSAKNM